MCHNNNNNAIAKEAKPQWIPPDLSCETIHDIHELSYETGDHLGLSYFSMENLRQIMTHLAATRLLGIASDWVTGFDPFESLDVNGTISYWSSADDDDDDEDGYYDRPRIDWQEYPGQGERQRRRRMQRDRTLCLAEIICATSCGPANSPRLHGAIMRRWVLAMPRARGVHHNKTQGPEATQISAAESDPEPA